MKDFDLAAAKRGATVCTRDGKPAKFLGILESPEGHIYVKAYVMVQMNLFNDGRNFRSIECDHDLMMADDDYLEKLERGEYDHIEDNLEKVSNPKKKIEFAKFGDYSEDVEQQLNDLTAKERDGFYKSLQVCADNDWDYWRLAYAGMAMQGLMADTEYKKYAARAEEEDTTIIAKAAISVSDALIAELKKTQK